MHVNGSVLLLVMLVLAAALLGGWSWDPGFMA
jgi:hypothetical protein